MEQFHPRLIAQSLDKIATTNVGKVATASCKTGKHSTSFQRRILPGKNWAPAKEEEES